MSDENLSTYIKNLKQIVKKKEVKEKIVKKKEVKEKIVKKKEVKEKIVKKKEVKEKIFLTRNTNVKHKLNPIINTLKHNIIINNLDPPTYLPLIYFQKVLGKLPFTIPHNIMPNEKMVFTALKKKQAFPNYINYVSTKKLFQHKCLFLTFLNCINEHNKNIPVFEFHNELKNIISTPASSGIELFFKQRNIIIL